MVVDIRVLLAAPDSHTEGMAAHLKRLQADGFSIIYVTADRPYASLHLRYKGLGVDVDSIFFLDAVTSMDGAAVQNRPPNALFLQSPTMLEMMAMRVEQLLGRVGPKPMVIIDSLSTLALYNGTPPVQEFSHYLANRLRTNDAPGDFVIRANRAGLELHERIRGFTDGSVTAEVEK